jgi:GNAT superfamily N-acetyltransferase
VIRGARADDYELYVRLYLELATPDPPLSRERFESDLLADTFVLEDGGQSVAYGYVQVLDGVGYVRHVSVDPAARRRGLGRALMAEAASRFRAAGCASWCLNVKPENLPAVRLYESLGMDRAYASAAVRLAWNIGLPDGGGARPLADGERDGVEAAFGLPAGLLTKLRKNPRVVLMVVERGGAITGLASFDPSFPGCFPFRARSVEDAGALHAALRLHAASDQPIQLVLEDAPELVRALTERGAAMVMEFVHYRGALG